MVVPSPPHARRGLGRAQGALKWCGDEVGAS
jgi:hypothetical protein